MGRQGEGRGEGRGERERGEEGKRGGERERGDIRIPYHNIVNNMKEFLDSSLFRKENRYHIKVQ